MMSVTCYGRVSGHEFNRKKKCENWYRDAILTSLWPSKQQLVKVYLWWKLFIRDFLGEHVKYCGTFSKNITFSKVAQHRHFQFGTDPFSQYFLIKQDISILSGTADRGNSNSNSSYHTFVWSEFTICLNNTHLSLENDVLRQNNE